MGRVVVVGAGIAGIACASALHAAGLAVEVRDRGPVIGGRMASPWIDGRVVDSGASYLTARGPEFRSVVADWETRGLIRPWTATFSVIDGEGTTRAGSAGPLRYAAPRGLQSLVADLAARSGLLVRRSTPVSLVEAGPVVDGEPVDAVVLAMPDQQALPLLAPGLEAERAALQSPPWQPTLALLAGWERRGWPPLDGAFVHDSPVISWIADDGRRRGDLAPVLVAHSGPGFARRHLTDPPAAAGELTRAMRRLLDVGPEPAWTRVQRWSFARPSRARTAPFFLGGARVGLAGDGWGEARIETAWLSGTALGRALVNQLG